ADVSTGHRAAHDLAGSGALHTDRYQARRRVRVHRGHRLGVHHVARWHRLRDQLRVHELRQRDHVPADRVDTACFRRDQRGAVALGRAVVGASGVAMTAPMNALRWSGLKNASVLIGALLVIWQVLYWWVGDVALASPLATLRYTEKLLTGDTFDMHAYDTLRAFTI